MKVKVEDPRALKGQYLRHTRDNTVWEIRDVGRLGVTAYQVASDGNSYPPENIITWRAVRALYTILVGLEDIDMEKIRK